MANLVPCTNPAHGVKHHQAGSTAAHECALSIAAGSKGSSRVSATVPSSISAECHHSSATKIGLDADGSTIYRCDSCGEVWNSGNDDDDSQSDDWWQSAAAIPLSDGAELVSVVNTIRGPRRVVRIEDRYWVAAEDGEDGRGPYSTPEAAETVAPWSQDYWRNPSYDTPDGPTREIHRISPPDESESERPQNPERSIEEWETVLSDHLGESPEDWAAGEPLRVGLEAIKYSSYTLPEAAAIAKKVAAGDTAYSDGTLHSQYGEHKAEDADYAYSVGGDYWLPGNKWTFKNGATISPFEYSGRGTTFRVYPSGVNRETYSPELYGSLREASDAAVASEPGEWVSHPDFL